MLSEIYNGNYFPDSIPTIYDEMILDYSNKLKECEQNGDFKDYRLVVEDLREVLVLQGFERGVKFAARLLCAAFGE